MLGSKDCDELQFNGRAMKTGFRAVSSPTVHYRTQSNHSKKENTKQMFPWKAQNKKCQQQTQHQNISSSRAEQYVYHHLSHDHVPLCTIFLGRFSFSDGGKRWLIGISNHNPFDYTTSPQRLYTRSQPRIMTNNKAYTGIG